MRTVPPLLSIIAVISVLTLFVYFIPDTEARRSGGGKSYSRSGHASSGSFRGSKSYRHDSRGQNRSSRGYSNRGRRDNRQDHRSDVRDDRRRIRRRQHRRLSVRSFNALTCHRTIILYRGVRYHRCGTVWYNQVYSGPHVTYIVVDVPPGY